MLRLLLIEASRNSEIRKEVGEEWQTKIKDGDETWWVCGVNIYWQCTHIHKANKKKVRSDGREKDVKRMHAKA